MIDIIIGTLLAGSAVKNGVDNFQRDVDGMRNRRYNDLNVYLSHDGWRDLTNHKRRWFRRDINNDVWLDGEEFKEYNWSQKKRDEEFSRLKNDPNNNRTAYKINGKQVQWVKYKDRSFEVVKYKDLFTEDILFISAHEMWTKKNSKEFYIRLRDMKVMRYTDGQKQDDISKGVYNEEEEQERIMAFQNDIYNELSSGGFNNNPAHIHGVYPNGKTQHPTMGYSPDYVRTGNVVDHSEPLRQAGDIYE